MKSTRRSCQAYTIGEMVVSMAIVLLVVATATSGWIYVNRGERVNAIQTELDLDVRKTMEMLKRDLRLSSLDKIFFYPSGPGPYTAISFPLAKDNNGDGVIELGLDSDKDGFIEQSEASPYGTNIIWDSTVIYHVQTTTPYRLLRTVFEPRDNTLTDAQRVAQITSVATYGHGTNTYNGSNSTTKTVFENLFTWSIEGKGATFDSYSPALQRKNTSFGSILLGPGAHTVKFSVVGKNPSSAGFRIGVDTLTVSPSAAEREAEAQLPVASQSGASAAWEYRTEGSWSANNHLAFPASGANAFFTLSMENDRWEETNFRGIGASLFRTDVFWSESLTPKNFVLRLEGYGYTWMAANQTQTGSYHNITDNSPTNRTYRVVLRGRDMQEGSFIDFNGQNPYVFFKAADGIGTAFKINKVYIGEAGDPTNSSPNAIGTMRQLKFYNAFLDGSTITEGNYDYARLPSGVFAIDKNKSYIISYQISDDRAQAIAYSETHTNVPGSYYIDNPASGDVNLADWSSRPWKTDPRIVGLWLVHTTYPTNGTFTSQIFDTKMQTPSYQTMTWNADIPWSSIGMKIRTGSQPDMSDAPAWSNVTSMSSGGNINPGAKRYAQFQATLNASSSGGWYTPTLKDVTVRWTGDTKVVDVAAQMTTGPQYGICAVTVDDKPLVKGLKINLTIFKDIVGWTPNSMRVTSSMSAEVEPRNTDK